jgi:hypothetical protein
MKFRQYTINGLQQAKHPEVQTTPLERMLHEVQMEEQGAVITWNGEVLGFLVKDLPQSLQAKAATAACDPLHQGNLNRKTFRAWGSHGVVRITRRSRFRAYFVGPQYASHLSFENVGD